MRSSAPRPNCRPWDLLTGCIITRRKCRVANNNAWLWLVLRAPRPDILLADEPTGNLDAATGAAIMDLLFALNERHGATLVLVTHAPELAERCARIVHLIDGRIDSDTKQQAAAE